MSEWYVYMIRCSDHNLYTGVSTDVERRFREHGSGRGAKFFYGRKPEAVVYREHFPDRGSAQKREAAIKQLSRTEKLCLISSQIEAGEELESASD